MSAKHLEEVDATLLLLSEARERAGRAARTISENSGRPYIVDALERVDRELLALHRQLMDETYFRPAGTVERVERVEQQLAL